MQNKHKKSKRAIVPAFMFALLASICFIGGCTGKNNGKKGQDTVKNSGENAANNGQPAEIATGGTVSNPEEIAKSLKSEKHPKLQKEDIRGVSVAEGGDIRYQFNYTPRNDRDSYLFWDMPVPYSSTAVVDTENMYLLFEAISALDLTNASATQAKEPGASQDNLTSKEPEASQDNLTSKEPGANQDGLPAKEPGANTGSLPEMGNTGSYLTVNYYKGDTSSGGQADPNYTMTLVSGQKKNGYYICTLKGQENNPLQLNAQSIDSILHRDTYSMILKIPYVIKADTVKKVTIHYQGQQFPMIAENDSYSINGKNADRKEYLDLYACLMQPMLDGEIDKDATPDKDKEELLSITYERNLAGAEDYEVIIYAYKGGKYTSCVNGREQFYLNADDVKVLEQEIQDVFIK